ncbi:MAG: hypothetical protein ACKO24_11560 [Leptolyngbyaceae cyanobacterium]
MAAKLELGNELRDKNPLAAAIALYKIGVSETWAWRDRTEARIWTLIQLRLYQFNVMLHKIHPTACGTSPW